MWRWFRCRYLHRCTLDPEAEPGPDGRMRYFYRCPICGGETPG
jgi:hypothetical protein